MPVDTTENTSVALCNDTTGKMRSASNGEKKLLLQSKISNNVCNLQTNLDQQVSPPSSEVNIRPNGLSKSISETHTKQKLSPNFGSQKTLNFRRSTSISIPILQNTNEKVESLMSQSCSIRERTQPKYGSINNGINEQTLPPNQGARDFSSNHNENKLEERLYCGFTKRQLKVFISLVLLSLNDIMGYSAIAPFFPVVASAPNRLALKKVISESAALNLANLFVVVAFSTALVQSAYTYVNNHIAANKGLTPIHIGLIFAAYSVCGMFAALLVGKVLVKVGAKFLVLAGMFWNTGAIFCFGFLNSTSTTPFLVLGIVSRGLMGLGSNMAFTAMFAIIFQEFTERAITVLSLSEALVGVGGMVAPLIGGALYDAGGYMTPFLVLGSVQALLLVACHFMLPYVPVEEKMASKSPFYLLRHSSALLAVLVVIYVFTVNSFITANIAPFLADQFNMDAVMVGVVFLISSVFYAGLSPVWGYVADRWKNSYLMEVSTFGISLGMTFVGPALFLRSWFGWTSQKLWLLYLTAVVNGTFFGGALMPTFNEIFKAAKELKLTDTVLAQYGLVSGLWNTAFAIGDILGPTVGGVVVEKMGYQNCSAVFGLIGFVLCCLKLIQRYARHRTRSKRHLEEDNDEEEPLLDEATASVNA